MTVVPIGTYDQALGAAFVQLDTGRPWAERLAVMIDMPCPFYMRATSRTVASSTASMLNSGHLKTPPGRWRFKSRTVAGNPYVVGVYLGPDTNESEMTS